MTFFFQIVNILKTMRLTRLHLIEKQFPKWGDHLKKLPVNIDKR